MFTGQLGTRQSELGAVELGYYHAVATFIRVMAALSAIVGPAAALSPASGPGAALAAVTPAAAAPGSVSIASAVLSPEPAPMSTPD